MFRRKNSQADLAELNLFAGTEHRPFVLEGGRPAALLVHGFPGTPDEMRPLAQALHAQGWTARAVLLPGFGPEIGTLFQRRKQDWLDHVRRELQLLKVNHSPVLLVGYSMGAALALQVAAKEKPDALLLLAPLWRIGNRLHALIWQVVRRLFPSIKPLRAVPLNDTRVQEAVGGFLPDLDLDDPHVQSSLQQLRVPTRLIDQVLFVGRDSAKAAAQITVPTLILQGTDDEAVRAAITRKLLRHFPGPIRYTEIVAGHDFIQENSPGWQELMDRALAFAAEVETDR